MKFKLILGGPGTGKTEHLIRLVESELAGGLRPEQIAFVAFTRAAASEARVRAAAALGIAERELPYFRTLHSLCFHLLGLRRSDVLEGESLRELEKLTGESASRDGLMGDAGPWELEQLARASFVDPIALANDSDIDIFRFKRAVAAAKKFKDARGLLDFTDMLERYVEWGEPLQDVRLAIVDEVQDLTPLQWKVVERAFSETPRIIVAGDDDQAIHEWSGATLKPLFEHTGEREVLTVSHRLTKDVHELSNRVSAKISHRLEKPTVSNGKDGFVEWYTDPSEVSLALSGTWLLLVRAKFQLNLMTEAARIAGVPFMCRGRSSINQDLLDAAVAYEKKNADSPVRWHDALTKFSLEDREYLLACRRGGEKLNVRPRVSIETVHGAKGRQADHVLIMSDLTSRIDKRMQLDPDAENRVLYVGLTRARVSLNIIQPTKLYAWSF